MERERDRKFRDRDRQIDRQAGRQTEKEMFYKDWGRETLGERERGGGGGGGGGEGEKVKMKGR